jgi:tetratricopeptide (TPR) repeat protein
MLRFGKIGAPCGTRTPATLAGFCLLALASGKGIAADGLTSCAPALGRVVSVQGSVEVLRAGASSWQRVARLNTPVCASDQVRAGLLSRAALFISPETLVRLDQNTTLAILSQSEQETIVEFKQDDVTRSRAPRAQACGIGYFITRFPRKFRVRTPFYNAVVEGTEFQVALQCDRGDLSVFEGKVAAESIDSAADRVVLESGQNVSVGPGEAPKAVKIRVRPADAVQWAVYYPPLSDTPASLEQALAEDCGALPETERSACVVRRAEALLRVGRVTESGTELDQLLAADPSNAEALALNAVIAIAKNDKNRALELATKAAQAGPRSFRAWIALSYARQAGFRLEDALSAASKAAEVAPQSALVRTRVAELLLSLGRIRDAEKEARAAVSLNPAENRAHLMLGFVHLAQIDTKAAKQDFETAIELDSSEPLARLGLGLAIIRGGKLAEGREQIEIAVALDPTNSLLRSYVGKAYYEENTKARDKLARAELEIAKQLDPADPTPWFYEAILRQTENQPVDALVQLQASIERNDNRAVSRSRLLLDQDNAARNASSAALFQELGFERLGIIESTKALDENFDDPSAHRLLASAYLNAPRHDIARVSEALQAQIRQPLTVYAVDPQLRFDNLGVLRGLGPSRIGLTEFNPLYSREQERFQFDAMSGERNTVADQLLLAGLYKNVSATLTQFHYETDGFLENNSVRRNIVDLFMQGQLSPYSSIQLDLKDSRFKLGETFFRFDPTFLLPATIDEESVTYRLSGRLESSLASNWIWTVAYQDRFRSANSFPDGALITDTDASAYTAEVQNAATWGDVRLISGMTQIVDRRDFQFEQVMVRSSALSAYGYGQWRSRDLGLHVHLGLAVEVYERTHSDHANSVERNRLSPKAAVAWTPRVGTAIRFAALSAVRRPFIDNQTIEPTQVAGFNQFFTGLELLYGDVEGTVSRRTAIAFDQALSQTMFAGVELARRQMEVPSINLARDFIWREWTASAYAYKTFPRMIPSGSFSRWTSALGLDVNVERLERPQRMTGSEGIMDLETVRVPLGVRFFRENGFSIRMDATYIRQSGTFSLDEGFDIINRADSAWILDAALEYKFPGRSGAIMVGVRNLADQFVGLVETDPVNPRVPPRRFAFVQLRLTPW